MRNILAVLALVMSVGSQALADTENLQQFLHRAEEATAVPVPLRADGELTVTTPDGSRRTAVAMIIRPTADTYIELKDPPTKAVLLGDKDQAYVVEKDAAKAADMALSATFADSDFTREDLEPFRLARYKDWRISDESSGEITVTLFPKTSQYSLVVITFDREKAMPLKTLYYKDTLNNLVKMRRDGDYVLIGRKSVPTTSSMETFKLRTHSTFTLRWTQSPSFPPELFDPAFLPRPSNLVWPMAKP